MTAHPIGTPPRLPADPPTLRRRLLMAVAVLLPVLELAVLIGVWSRIGAGATLLLLLAGLVTGSLVVRQVGLAAVARLRASATPTGAPAAPAAGHPPERGGRSPADALLMVTAGVLLAVPGFLSDLVGLALLVPGVRRALLQRAGDAVLRRVPTVHVRVVQGQVLDDDRGSRPRPPGSTDPGGPILPPPR